jgi:hypothetical protein
MALVAISLCCRSPGRSKYPAPALDGPADPRRIYPDGAPPKARTAVSGWLWFIDGACLNWIEHRDIERDELRDLLLAVLMGALIAAGAPPDLSQG